MNDSLFFVFDYYRDGAVFMKATSKSYNPLYELAFVSTRAEYSVHGDTIEFYQYNDRSELHGKRLSKYESGQIKFRGQLSHNKPIGKFESFYKNGRLESKGHYSDNGKRVGTWLWYYDSGAKAAGGVYNAKGNENGSWLSYHENGRLKEKMFFVDGQLRDSVANYYENGALQSIFYLDTLGVPQGEKEMFYSNSRLYERSLFRDGNKVGRTISYYPSGETRIVTVWEKGIPEGNQVEYWPNGNFRHLKKWKKRLVKEEKWFDENGMEVESSHACYGQKFNEEQLKRTLSKHLHSAKRGWAKDRVVLSFEIDTNGRTRSVDILETANDVLDSAMIKAIGVMEWGIARYQGKPVAIGNDICINLGYEEILGIKFGHAYVIKDELDESRSIFSEVDRAAEYEGGEVGFSEFLFRETKIPEPAFDLNIAGDLLLRFKIGKSGLACDPNIIEKSHPVFNDEAVRAVHKMAVWSPSITNGDRELVQRSITMHFDH
ncbi:MAG: energy transducer TonB [Flavobacteriales bacterium]